MQQTYKMTEKFRVRPRFGFKQFEGAYVREITKDRIQAITSGTVTADLVPADAQISDGNVVTFSDVDSHTVLYFTYVQNVRSFDSVAAAKKKVPALGDVEQIRGPVQVFDITEFLPVPVAKVERIPYDEPQYDVLELVGSNATRYFVSAHASDLQDERARVKAGDLSALSALPTATSTICVSEMTENGLKPCYKYTFNSAPLFVVMTPEQLAARPEELVTYEGLAVPWRGQNVSITPGIEAVHILLTLVGDLVVVMYERQLEVFPINLVRGGLTLPLVICSTSITTCIFEAAVKLLNNHGDTVRIAVFAPETGGITPNERAGWRLVEGTVDYEPEMAADAFESVSDAVAYLRSSWRNFLHVRYPDGAQLVVMSPRRFSARPLAAFPLSHVKLSECRNNGNRYLLTAMCRCAESIVEDAFKASVLGDKGYLVRLFYDQECKQSFGDLMKFFNTAFEERYAATSTPTIRISPDALRLMDNKPHVTIQLQPGKFSDVKTAIERASPSEIQTIGTMIYELVMSRFLRYCISAIYVLYGSGESSHHQYAYIVYRHVKTALAARARIYYLINNRFEAIEKEAGSFVGRPVMSRLWSIVQRSHGIARQQLFMAFVLNRGQMQFAEVLPELENIYYKSL